MVSSVQTQPGAEKKPFMRGRNAKVGYYAHLQRVFLLNALLVPLVPMLLVSLIIFFSYDVRYSGTVRESVVGPTPEADATLFQARLITLLCLAGAFGFVVLRARTLSRKMVERIVSTEQEKQRMSEQMFQTAKLASVGELASGVAHEINNPIAVMIEEAGWMRDLLDEEDLRDAKHYEEFSRSLEQIRKQGQRCKEITRKLLSFARQCDSDVTEAKIDGLLEDLLSVVRRRAEKRRVTVTTSIQDGLPPVSISYSELQQVLFNLINNAMDAMDPDGGRLHVGARLEDAEILVEVRDTGPGIPQEVIDRVFDPFFTTKPVGKGTGLGLSICYGLVGKWGGRIRAENMSGGGARFWFTIPLKPAQASAEEAAQEKHGEACVLPGEA